MDSVFSMPHADDLCGSVALAYDGHLGRCTFMAVLGRPWFLRSDSGQPNRLHDVDKGAETSRHMTMTGIVETQTGE